MKTELIGRRWRWLSLGLLLGLTVIYTWATWYYYTSRISGGNDFLSHYSLWQACLKYGLNPYSDEAVRQTQLAIYGRPAHPNEDQNRLVYPVYSIILYGPFIFIDYPVADAVFMVLLQAGLFAGMVMTLSLVSWRPPPWLLATVLAWSLLNYHEARAVIIGQFAVFGFFVLAGTLFLLKQRCYLAAGLLFVLLTIKPTLIFLAAPFLLLWAATRRRWRFVLGFLGGTAFLTLVSLLIWPTWIGDWLGRVGSYPEYTAGQGLVWLLTHRAFPGLGQMGEAIIVTLLVAGMLYVWWRIMRDPLKGDHEFHWAFGVTLVMSNLILSRSATPNYALMLIPTVWVFAALDRRGRRGRLALLLVMLVALVGHWWLHFATVVGNAEQPIMFVPWPVALGITLWAGRSWLLRDAAQAGVRL